jgi:MazG family protein
MERLRSPDGCPWDREQTLETLRPYLLEETYEVLDAIDRQDWPHLAEELGDLQLQIVFQSQIASEKGLFTIDQVLDHIHDKLIRRHPHVFGEESLRTAGEVVDRWDQLKKEEKLRAHSGASVHSKSILDEVPRNQPALLEAQEVGKKAAKVGFDWKRFDDLIEKLHEELEELGRARTAQAREQIEEEVGDLLFMLVNIARHLKVNPEIALRATNRKFRERFGFIENRLGEMGKSCEEVTLEEMEELWQLAKQPREAG